MKLTPDAALAQLRAIREELADEIGAMTAKERRVLRNRTKSSDELIQKSVTAIGLSEMISKAVRKDTEQMFQLLAIDGKWRQLESELSAFLNEVSSARLARHRELDLIATQTFALVKQLIRVPGNENLIQVYEDMRNIRREERRKKRRAASPDGEEPSPSS
jgi:hypothetical protein